MFDPMADFPPFSIIWIYSINGHHIEFNELNVGSIYIKITSKLHCTLVSTIILRSYSDHSFLPKLIGINEKLDFLKTLPNIKLHLQLLWPLSHSGDTFLKSFTLSCFFNCLILCHLNEVWPSWQLVIYQPELNKIVTFVDFWVSRNVIKNKHERLHVKIGKNSC